MVELATPPISTLLAQPPRFRLDNSNRFQLSEAEQRERINEAAEEFESQFLSLMIDNMFTDIDGEGIFGAGQGEQIYRSFISDEYGKALAENGGVGIAASIRSELLRLQEIPEEEVES